MQAFRSPIFCTVRVHVLLPTSIEYQYHTQLPVLCRSLFVENCTKIIEYCTKLPNLIDNARHGVYSRGVITT